MSGERGRITPVAVEAYSLRDVMFKITGVEYDIVEALPNFPPPRDRASWYLLGREFRKPRGVPHARIVWDDQEGHVFIESMYIGDSTEWIGPVYGEEGIIAAMKIDYSNPDRGRKEFADKFPAVERRIREYEAVLARVSSQRHASLNLRATGENANATFFIVARIDLRDLAPEKKAEVMRLNVQALKEAWDEIGPHGSHDRHR